VSWRLLCTVFLCCRTHTFPPARGALKCTHAPLFFFSQNDTPTILSGDEHINFDVALLIWTCGITHTLHYSFVCVTWLRCDTIHCSVWHDSCVTWLMCDMTHSHVWHDSHNHTLTIVRGHAHINFDVTWPIRTFDIAHVWHDPFMCDPTISLTILRCNKHINFDVTWLTRTCDIVDM